MANIVQINGYTISSSNGGEGASDFPYTGSAIISGSLIITGSATSTLGFTGSLFGTSSWAANAVTSSHLVSLPGKIFGDNSGVFYITSSNRIFITASNQISIGAPNGIFFTQGTTTVTGNLLPGSPITDNTSSWSLGSPSAAWKDLYVSNGSVYFISGSVSSSIQFNDGQITFSGANLIIPSGSTISTASFARTSSYSPTLGASLFQPAVGNLQLRNSDSTTISTITDFAASTATSASFASTASLSTSSSFATTASFAQNVYAPSFITYTGGTVTNATTSLADVHSSAGWNNITAGFYEFEIITTYNVPITTTGARFSISGSVTFNYLACDIGYNTLTTDRAAYIISAFDGGTAAASSLATNNNLSIMQGHINTTSTGQLRLRFSTEVSASGLQVTNVIGYLRRLY